MLRREFDIASFIAKSLAGTMSEEERALLEAWKEEDIAHRRLFERLSSPENLARRNEHAERYRKLQRWEDLEKRIDNRRFVTVRRVTTYAALLIILFVASYFVFRLSEGSNEEVGQARLIRPGEAKAVLVLADGQHVTLETRSSFTLQESDGTVICKDSSVLDYRGKNERETTGEEVIYNTIKTPLGGEYFLVLSDGSRVHLNAMSSLRFPVRFMRERREVELTGEAYFEVEKDNRLFVVTTGETSTEVLGTKFNVSAYPEDEEVKTTLIRGSVRFTAKVRGKSFLLKPSEQVSFNKLSGEAKVEEVDVADFIAWKEGLFRFKDWRLEEIMEQLARWYDMKVEFREEALKDIRFGCCFNRYRDITPVLELLEETCKVRVKVEGNTVVLEKANTKTK